MTAAAMPYRIAIRESGSTQAVTDWLEEKISPDSWKIELLGVEEYDDDNRKIQYVVRFRHQVDMQRFREKFLKKKAPAPVGRTRTSARGGAQRANDNWIRMTVFGAFWRLILNPNEEVFVRRKAG